MTNAKLHAKVYGYRGHIVIEQITMNSVPDEFVTMLDTPGNLGQVVCKTREHLGVSSEALELLRTIKPGRDGLGEVMWFKTNDGHHAFGWLGGCYLALDVTDIVTSRDYVVPESDFVLIENTVPEGAMAFVDAQMQ